MSESGSIINKQEVAYLTAQERANSRLSGGVKDSVSKVVDGIDFNNIGLRRYEDIGVKYNRYPITHNGKTYRIEIMQPINRTAPRYDVSLLGGNEVATLNSVDLSKSSPKEVKDYLKKAMALYIDVDSKGENMYKDFYKKL